MNALKHLSDWLPTKGLHVSEFLLASVFLSPITHFKICPKTAKR